MSIQEFYNEYEKYNKANKYILGFIYKKQVYFLVTNTCDYGVKMERTSSNRGSIPNLRFKPNNTDKMAMLENATYLMSEQEFNNLVNENKYNKGENFEKIITEMYGQKWEKDVLPFYKGGDLVVNDISYQIKFQSATFCTLNQIEKLRVA